MALALKKNSKWWYGEFVADGELYRSNLKVEVRGTRPASLKDKGDNAFEASRQKAKARLEELRTNSTERDCAAGLLRRAHEIQSGIKIVRVPLSSLGSHWVIREVGEVPPAGKTAVSEGHWKNCTMMVREFVDYMRRAHPAKKDVFGVSKAVADGFMQEVQARGVTTTTWKRYRSQLSAAFSAVATQAGLTANPFDELKWRGPQTRIAHRHVFSDAEISRLVVAAEGDTVIGPVAILCLLTGLRRFDAAMLRWGQINWEENRIELDTSKTDETVFPPILPRLMILFKKLPRTSEFCFPEAAEMLQEKNSNGLTWRFKKILEAAGIAYDDEADTKRYVGRLRKASRRGMHALKTTFITHGLQGGLALATLKTVTGNRDDNTLGKSYFHPSSGAIEKQLLAHLPSSLTGDTGTSVDARAIVDVVVAQLDSCTEANWQTMHAFMRDGLLRLRDHVLSLQPPGKKNP